MGARYIVSDTLSRLAQKHGVGVVYEASREWVAYIDRQRVVADEVPVYCKTCGLRLVLSDGADT